MTTATELRTELARSLRAGARGVVVTTDDEVRAIGLLEDVGRELAWPVHTWSAAAGIDGAGTPRPIVELLDRLRGDRDDALWIVLDGGGMLDAASLRRIRELAQRVVGPAIVLVERVASPVLARVPELVAIELAPPDDAELRHRLQQIALTLQHSGFPDAVARLAQASDAIVEAASGLPSFAYERLLAEAVTGGSLDAIAAHLRAEKPRVLGRGGLLDIVASSDTSALGGLDHLKRWLALRKVSFEPGAARAGITPARGCLLVGVQGCGKSLAARVCGHELGLPLVRLEPGRLFGGTVGESEANLRRALADVDRLAPCVLWIDELDKGFAGVEGSASDAGTAARVLGGLLTWLQERTRPSFVVATANRVDLLPAELLRRGRFDEIFFVDLPDSDAREQIARLHWRGTTDAWAPFAAVARRADGYSGAELAAALGEARLVAYAAGRDPVADDFANALAASIPLSVLRAEDVGALRRWASGRARPA